MELGRPGVRDAQPDRGDARLDRVDVLPVDVALGRRQAQVPGQDPDTAPSIPSRRSSPAAPTSTADQVELALDVVEPRSLTRTTLRPSMSTICLSSRSVAQPDLVRALLEAVMSMVAARQARAGGVEPGDVRPGQEDPAPVGRDDQAGDRRIAVADGDDEVVDLADRLAIGDRARVGRWPGSGRAWVPPHERDIPPGWRDRGGPRSTVNERDGPVPGDDATVAPTGLGPSSTGDVLTSERDGTAGTALGRDAAGV